MTHTDVNRTRRELLTAAAAAALLPKRVRAGTTVLPRVVVVVPGPAWKDAALVRQFFADEGLRHGQNVSISFEEIDGNRERGEHDVRRIIASRPQVIVTPTRAQLWLMKELTHDIPIVFTDLIIDPVRSGLVASMRMPGGNITGTCHSQRWQGRMLSLLRQIDPGLRVVGLLWSSDDFQSFWNHEYVREAAARQRQADREDAARYGIGTRQVSVPTESTEEEIATAVGKSGAQALLVSFPRTEASDAYLNHTRLPTVGMFLSSLRRGMLVAITIDTDEGQQEAIKIVARILRGESPASIPIYQLTRYYTGVNLRTAKRIGVRIPDSLIVQAAEIVR